MKFTIEAFAVIFVTMFLIAAGEVLLSDNKNKIIYDCRIAEISPDYPVEVKNLCRKMMK